MSYMGRQFYYNRLELSLTMAKIITIVEDNASIRQMYRYMLELFGYEVHIAENGEEGLTVINSVKPDLILLDLNMPVMNGDEMLARLRAQETLSDTRVFVLTNISKAEVPSNLRVLNIDRYIIKAHHTPRQVAQIVQETLGS